MGKDEGKVDGVITASYRVNLHCVQCAREIKNPLMRTQGIQIVETKIESGEIRVQGVFDPKKIHERIRRLSRKRVELIGPPVKIIEIKEVVFTITIKVNMHCVKCECDLRKNLLKHKGIYTVKTDLEAQILIVEGTIESDKLLVYIRKKVHKHAEIVTVKSNKITKTEEEVKVKVEAKIIEVTNYPEFRRDTCLETRITDCAAPCSLHYTMFSDENPNSCAIM